MYYNILLAILYVKKEKIYQKILILKRFYLHWLLNVSAGSEFQTHFLIQSTFLIYVLNAYADLFTAIKYFFIFQLHSLLQ